MNLAQSMSLVVPPVQDLKRRAQRRTDGQTTMFPTLLALRDDRVLCVVTAPRMQPLLACAATLAIGLAPQLLVLAAQVTLPERAAADGVPAQQAGEGIAYTAMSRDREGALAVQRYQVGPDGREVRFGPPLKGRPDARDLLEHLAAAMSRAPLDPTRVARKGTAGGASGPGPGGTPDFLPAAKGRLAIDTGAAAAAQRRVAGVRGTVLYLAASPAQATELLGLGMPQELLLS